jgi:2-octaprenyl-6-methoxyphenol hydroxylase
VLAAGRNLGLLGMDIVAPLKSVFARQAMGLKG